MGRVGEYDGDCDGAERTKSLAEGERTGGEDVSADGRRCGRCARGVSSGAFGDRLDKVGAVGTSCAWGWAVGS